MLWKRENHNQIHRNTEQISTGIVVRTGGFYFHEKPANPTNQLLCVEPRYEDSDPGFPQFMRLCGAQILSQYSFVLEHLESCKDFPELEHAPFAAAYQALGGNIICQTASTLLSVSEYDSPKLLQLIPEDDLLRYAYYGYGYYQALSKPNFAQLEKSPFDVRIFCHELHDYLLIEVSGDAQNCINQIKTLCEKERRQLTLQ